MGWAAARAVLAAYAANELPPGGRAILLTSLLETHAQGARVLVVEPIARRSLPWWRDWQAAVERAGGRADEWRFPADLPPDPARAGASRGTRPPGADRTLAFPLAWAPSGTALQGGVIICRLGRSGNAEC